MWIANDSEVEYNMEKTHHYSLEQLRTRHKYCISGAEVARQVRQGRIPHYFENPDKYAPYCEQPIDGICMAPDVSDIAYDSYQGTSE